MGKRSAKQLVELFKKNKVVKFGEMQKTLGNASRITTYRYLRQVPYMRSYNYNGGWYTLLDQVTFDRRGIFSYGDVHFSKDGSLTDTVKRLVDECTAGYTQHELQNILHVRVQVVLLANVRNKQLRRERVGGIYLYLHCDHAIGLSQIEKRRNELAPHGHKSDSILLKDSTIILILLELIRHPGSGVPDIVRYLYGSSPPVAMEEVSAVFQRFDIDEISQKKEYPTR